MLKKTFVSDVDPDRFCTTYVHPFTLLVKVVFTIVLSNLNPRDAMHLSNEQCGETNRDGEQRTLHQTEWCGFHILDNEQ